MKSSGLSIPSKANATIPAMIGMQYAIMRHIPTASMDTDVSMPEAVDIIINAVSTPPLPPGVGMIPPIKFPIIPSLIVVSMSVFGTK